MDTCDSYISKESITKKACTPKYFTFIHQPYTAEEIAIIKLRELKMIDNAIIRGQEEENNAMIKAVKQHAVECATDTLQSEDINYTRSFYKKQKIHNDTHSPLSVIANTAIDTDAWRRNK
jgi:hypothetical protein